jgi:hypothetical protein
LIWRFTLVLIKINYGQIGDQTGLFYTTNPVLYTSGNRFARRTGTFGNLWLFHLSRRTTVMQDLLVRLKFSLEPDNQTNVNVEAWWIYTLKMAHIWYLRNFHVNISFICTYIYNQIILYTKISCFWGSYSLRWGNHFIKFVCATDVGQFQSIYPSGLDINVCPIPVKTDVGQVVLALRLSDGTSKTIRDSQTCHYDGQIYFHWYTILGLLYKRALFDLQFVHNLF